MHQFTENLDLQDTELNALAILVDLLRFYPSSANDCQDDLLSSLRQLFDLLCKDLGTG